MLFSVSRKFCPLLSLALLTVACGKKISEAEVKAQELLNPETRPSTYVLSLDGSVESSHMYKVPQNAQFGVPDKLNVVRGSTNNKVVEIYYEVSDFDVNDFQYRCIYKPSLNPTEMYLEKCVDFADRDLGDIRGPYNVISRDQYIRLKFTGASSTGVAVQASYYMIWK